MHLLQHILGKKQFLLIKHRAPEERKSWYYQYLLTKDIAFKEIKIFNLGKYLKDQYKKWGMKFISQDKDLLEQKSRTQIFLIFLEEVINSLILIYVVLKAFVGGILLGDFNDIYEKHVQRKIKRTKFSCTAKFDI